MPVLEIVADSEPTRNYDLVLRETVVGRHPECDVVLHDSTISRRHVRIYEQNDGFYIEDLGSQHGTLLNDEPLRVPERLKHDDRILIRTTLITYYDQVPVRAGDPSREETQPNSTILSARTGVIDRSSAADANAAQKLQALLEITHSLGGSLDVKHIFPKILESLFRIFPQASRGCILVAEGPSGKLVPHAIKHSDAAINSPSPISRTIANRVMSDGEAILSADARGDERFRASESIEGLEIRSVMCAPLIGTSGRPLGMIQIDTQDPSRQFSGDHLDVLVNVANLAGQAVGHARLHESQLEYVRQQRDLTMAKQVQLHFLPKGRPEIPGYQLFDHYRAAEEVGGDYFGYIRLSDGRIAIALGDVSGKGVQAALMMARLCSDFRYSVVANESPTVAVEALNREVEKMAVTGRFVTFTLCILDPQRHEVAVVNAGHMPPLVRRQSSKAVEQVGLDVAGPPLGVDRKRQYQAATVTLEPSDAVLMYTDGISEAFGDEKKMYGNDRIREVIATPKTAEAIVQSVLGDVSRFTSGAAQNDDRCLVCFMRES